MANYTYRNASSSTTRLGYRSGVGATRQTGASASSGTVCGSCGQLECLCRPRFFAGQLLTEEDLNRLDQYIVKKQRLHNRQLHGWGVACGMELHCDPCDNRVVVSAGYGLSPCGDDIVICQDEAVDVCELIQGCLDEARQIQPCDPPGYGNNGGCQDETEDWLLMVRYQETPSRGIAALRNTTAEARCRPCDCGSSGGCGCNEGGSKGQTPTASAKPQAAQCEATLVCEGYRFEVCRLPAGGKDDQLPAGAMAERFNACAKPLIDYFIGFANDLAGYQQMSMDELYALCCAVKGTLIELLAQHNAHNCTLQARLQALDCPQPDPEQYDLDSYRNAITERLQVIRVVWYYALIDCICSVILPVCETSDDPRLVLGRVTVRKQDCKVLRVCNLITERKFLTTFPNLQYWLSWMPYMRVIRQTMEQVCCSLSLKLDKGLGSYASKMDSSFDFAAFDRLGMASMPLAKSKTKSEQDFSGLFMNLLMGETGRMTPQRLFSGIMKLDDAEGQPYLSDLQRENLLPSLMMDHLAPAILGGGAASGLSAFAGLAAAGLSGGMAMEEGDLKSELSALKETVALQKQQIDALSQRIDKNQ